MGWEESESASRRQSYISGGLALREQGAVIKDWGGRYPVALVYPNRYHIGMSNLGYQVIYALINRRADFICERVFWEGPDAPLQAVESARPLTDFACLAFSFSYELDYLNLPAILQRAQIPLRSAERDDRHPLVIAGGPCVSANPMPVAPFIDALCIGEAEALLPGLLPLLTADLSRAERLARLATLPGVFVPSHNPSPAIIRRQWVENLDAWPAHSAVLTPDTELGELYLMEVERGCSWSCRFCLVSHTFCPIRFHSLSSLLAQAREGLQFRQRVGLVGPVVSDHPQIEDLLKGLLEMGAGFSLSSLRLTSLSHTLLELIARGGAESLAIAPEAGSERLRRVIRKGFSEEDILEAAGRIARHPFKQLKLYFMLGLPGETEDDIEEIIRLALKVQAITRSGGQRLSINAAPFVPKAGTPFQWLGMAEAELLEQRIRRLNDGLAGTGIAFKAESPQWSHIQAALSRGGVEMAEVIAAVERPTPAGWRRAVKKSGLDVQHYITADWDSRTALPWDMIEPAAGIKRLRQELDKANDTPFKGG
jgi:radical SAM superfamily enzyme YgiQ (UPF0313 family)